MCLLMPGIQAVLGRVDKDGAESACLAPVLHILTQTPTTPRSGSKQKAQLQLLRKAFATHVSSPRGNGFKLPINA